MSRKSRNREKKNCKLNFTKNLLWYINKIPFNNYIKKTHTSHKKQNDGDSGNIALVLSKIKEAIRLYNIKKYFCHSYKASFFFHIFVYIKCNSDLFNFENDSKFSWKQCDAFLDMISHINLCVLLFILVEGSFLVEFLAVFHYSLKKKKKKKKYEKKLIRVGCYFDNS